MEKFKVNCYDILIVGIDIIEFDVNIICELVFTIITSFYFIFFWKVNTKVFSLIILCINPHLSLLP